MFTPLVVMSAAISLSLASSTTRKSWHAAATCTRACHDAHPRVTLRARWAHLHGERRTAHEALPAATPQRLGDLERAPRGED